MKVKIHIGRTNVSKIFPNMFSKKRKRIRKKTKKLLLTSRPLFPSQRFPLKQEMPHPQEIFQAHKGYVRQS